MKENGKVQNFQKKKDYKNIFKSLNFKDVIIKILSSSNYSNKKWVTEQYDQMVMCDTVVRAGSDSAIIRIHNKKGDSSNRGLISKLL